jgi:WD40 repeat protein
VNEQRLREALRSVPVEDARARTLDVVRAAYGEREPVRRRRRLAPAIAVLACLLAAVVVVAAVNAPGDAVARWVREVLGTGHPRPRPALVRVPGGGRLLVTTGRDAWVVAPDGVRRRLGRSDGASWSPRGLYVLVWRGGELRAVEPNGRVHWSLARRGAITAARWSPLDGYRVAYLSGRSLRIVWGDGNNDHFLARAQAVAPAWRPDRAHVLAYAGWAAQVRVVAVDSQHQLWRARVRGVTELAWSPDGRKLAVATRHRVRLFARDGRRLAVRAMPRGVVVDDIAWSPDGRLTIVRRGPAGSRITVGGRTLFTGPRRLGRVAWSPDGRRLLVPWPAADQWLFLSGDDGRAAAVANIARQFGGAPGAVEWCCR